MEWITEHIRKYSKITTKQKIIIIFLLFIIGVVLQSFWHHSNFYLYQLTLILMICLQFNIISKMIVLFQTIKEKNRLGDGEVVGLVAKMQKQTSSILIIIISILFIFIYMITIINYKFIDLNITGIYGVLLGSLTFFLGIISYSYYLIYLNFINSLRDVELKIKEIAPAYNPDLIFLGKNFIVIERYFFCLGILYSLLYTILSFKKLVELKNHPDLLGQNVWFVITWLFILVFFVVAYPLFTIRSKYLLRSIVSKSKLEKNQFYLAMIDQWDKTKDGEKINHYLELIDRIEKSKNSPLDESDFWINRFFSIFTSIITLITPFITIYFESFN